MAKNMVSARKNEFPDWRIDFALNKINAVDDTNNWICENNGNMLDQPNE